MLTGEETFRTALLTSHEVIWQLLRGIALRGTFNFADPDVARITGTRTKIGAGVDALITPFFGARIMVNTYRNVGGTDVAELKYTQSGATLHVLY